MNSEPEGLRYRKPDMGKALHPNAPCDERGRRVVVLRTVLAVAEFKYATGLRVYVGEHDESRGMVHGPTRMAKAERDALFARLTALEEGRSR